MSSQQHQERIPMLRTASNGITLTDHKFYDVRSATSLSTSTNGLIVNNYSINSKNGFVTRVCCHVMKGVQRNIQKCVAALVVISFFSIILFTQYMDNSSTLVGWVFEIQLDYDNTMLLLGNLYLTCFHHKSIDRLNIFKAHTHTHDINIDIKSLTFQGCWSSDFLLNFYLKKLSEISRTKKSHICELVE